jgi:alpha-glucosidase
MGNAKDLTDLSIPYEDIKILKQKILEPGNLEKHPWLDRDEVFEIYKDWRKVFNEYDPPLTYV